MAWVRVTDPREVLPIEGHSDKAERSLWHDWAGKWVEVGSPHAPMDGGLFHCNTDLVWPLTERSVKEIEKTMGGRMTQHPHVCRHQIEAD